MLRVVWPLHRDHFEAHEARVAFVDGIAAVVQIGVYDAYSAFAQRQRLVGNATSLGIAR